MPSTILQFSAENNLISWLICQRTGSLFSHVDFVLPNGGLLGALPGGVKIRYQREKPWRYFRCEAPFEHGWKWAESQVGKPYDYAAVAMLGLPFPRNWLDDNRWYCSELVAASFLHAGHRIINPNSWGVTPRDLLISPTIKQIDY